MKPDESLKHKMLRHVDVVDGVHTIKYETPDVRLASAMREFPSRVLAEKVGAQSFNQYDDLRDAHLELIRESMEKDKEIELLNHRIKELECARNDAKVALDV